MAKRVFVFGCSYTCYSWPTWANMLELEYGHIENWGLPGLGNRAIAERLAECHAKNTFTADDLVIVQWSGHLRNDWWHQEPVLNRTRGWKTYGSIFNYHNDKLYDKKWIDTFFYEPAFLMHTLNNIVLSQALLKSTGCQWYMTSMSDIRNMGSDMRVNTTYGERSPLIDKHKSQGSYTAWEMVPTLKIYDKSIWQDHKDHWLMPLELFCQSHVELTFDFLDKANVHFLDIHPSVAQHRLWLEQELGSKLGIKDVTLALAQDLVDGINIVHKKFKYDKSAFEYALARKQGFPQAAIDKMNWPGSPLGF